MISWLKQNGIRYYNLGGINPQTNPGVYHFKKGLSGEDTLYLESFSACENPLSALFAKAASLRRTNARGWLARWFSLLAQEHHRTGAGR
jgi:lipid II:glycine glycyltransferase (peptidoglycan interpeptide bridge formation enzyme)